MAEGAARVKDCFRNHQQQMHCFWMAYRNPRGNKLPKTPSDSLPIRQTAGEVTLELAQDSTGRASSFDVKRKPTNWTQRFCVSLTSFASSCQTRQDKLGFLAPPHPPTPPLRRALFSDFGFRLSNEAASNILQCVIVEGQFPDHGRLVPRRHLLGCQARTANASPRCGQRFPETFL